jgi:hypothetical protein
MATQVPGGFSMRTFVALTLVLSLVRGTKADDLFFTGKDLAGWKGLDQHWSVRDGMLMGSTKPKGITFNTFLCSDKEYRDFEMKFQVKLVGGAGNSGIQIRSRIEDNEKYVVAGPQCDIGQVYWGSLYGERFGGMMKQSPPELVKKLVKADDFNDYHIVCRDKHVTIKINGATMVDGDFNMPEKGIIAYQLHGGGPMEVQFKNVDFKELK